MLEVNINIKQGSFNGHYAFSAQAGIMGVFGASGHGKTTLLNAISGIVKPNKGVISVNGVSLYSSELKTNVPIRKRKIGYVFQDYKLFPHYTVLKNLLYGSSVKKVDSSTKNVSSILGIEHLLSKKPNACSGGEKQRVALGRALMSQPELLIMDEPFASVDVDKREELMQYIKQVAHSYRIPILIVSHDFTDMLKLMDTMMYIENGEVRYCGNVFQALSKVDFLSNEKLFKQYQNILKLKVRGACETSEKVLYEAVNKPTGMRFLIESYVDLVPDDEVRVVLSPDDIIMATCPVYEVSTSNQVQGTLLRVIESPYMVKCVVDIGFQVLVSITVNAFERLGFSIGDSVWLQFKTTKLNVAANYSSSSQKLRIA